MKVLFVCNANIARSQMAQAFFSKLSSHESESAGVNADGELLVDPGPRLKDRSNQRVIHLFQEEEGVDLSERVRKQLTAEMAADADKIVMMTPPDRWPEYLDQNDKVEHWDIPDPVGQPYEQLRQAKNEVKRRIRKLVEEIG